jgi:acetyl-CoA carboxylase carboxyl transferase subunit alpha
VNNGAEMKESDLIMRSALDTVRLARHVKRPTTRDYIDALIDDFIELHGDRRFADDPAMVAGIGFLEGIPVTILGQQK